MVVVPAALRLAALSPALLVHTLAAGRTLPVPPGSAARTAFAVTLMLTLAVALVLTLAVTLVLALAVTLVLPVRLVSGMALRRLRGSGRGGDRKSERRDDDLHVHISEKS